MNQSHSYRTCIYTNKMKSWKLFFLYLLVKLIYICLPLKLCFKTNDCGFMWNSWYSGPHPKAVLQSFANRNKNDPRIQQTPLRYQIKACKRKSIWDIFPFFLFFFSFSFNNAWGQIVLYFSFLNIAVLPSPFQAPITGHYNITGWAWLPIYNVLGHD